MFTRKISRALVLFFLDLASPIRCSTSALRSFKMPIQSTLQSQSQPLLSTATVLLKLIGVQQLVSWSLTSLFSTNMAISQTKGQGWKVIHTQWRKASDILTSTLATFLFSSHPKRERDQEAHLNHYASAYNRGDNYRITRLKLNRHELNKHASLTKNTANINTKQTKSRFGRHLRPPAWKRSGSIFWKVRDRRRDRREGKTQKGRRKNTNRKGKQKQIIRISHMHTYTAPKSKSESQAH